MTATALITGVAGQDGILLARNLIRRGIQVVGTALPGTHARIRLYAPEVRVVEHDLRDAAGFATLIAEHQPATVYNLAAISSVQQSWDNPDAAAAINGTAVAAIVDTLLTQRDATGLDVRLFQASSAEVAGSAATAPYARAKATAEAAVAAGRERGLHATIGRLFPHESPLRPLDFVVRKIVHGAARIATGECETLTLGSLDVSRDWGYAGDHVEAMVSLVDLDEPHTVEIGTGTAHSLRHLVELAFAAVGVDDPWSHVVTDATLLRPVDAGVLVADCTALHNLTGWHPTMSFTDMVGHLADVELRRLTTGVEDDPAYLTV